MHMVSQELANDTHPPDALHPIPDFLSKSIWQEPNLIKTKILIPVQTRQLKVAQVTEYVLLFKCLGSAQILNKQSEVEVALQNMNARTLPTSAQSA